MVEILSSAPPSAGLDEYAPLAGHSLPAPETRLPSLEFLSHELSQQARLRWRQVLLFILRIGIQHVERLFSRSPVVDYAQPTALAGPWHSPAYFPNTTRAPDDRPLLRPQHQRDLQAPVRLIVVEPREGGRWYEVDTDGTETEWGKVLEWGPPTRLVLAWQLRADFSYDPDFQNEVELTFAPAEGGTLVTLTHHNLHRFGDAAAAMAPSLSEGWGMLLGLYAGHAAEEGAG